MDPVSAIALTLGVGWASGVNLYAAMLALGIMGATGAMALPPDLQMLASPVVILAAGLILAVVPVRPDRSSDRLKKHKSLKFPSNVKRC